MPEPSSNTAASAADESGVAPNKRSSSSYARSAILRAPSRAIKQVPWELRRLTSFRRRRRGGGDVSGPHDRSTTAAARAQDGFRFIGGAAAGWEWKDVADRFDELTAHQDGVLYRSQFGQCIGMKKMEEKKDDGEGKTKADREHRDRRTQSGSCCFFGDPPETGSASNDEKQPSPAAAATDKKPADKPDFAGELFDALNRWRPQPAGDGITKAEMAVFWEHINNTSFESRLQIFFDMVDKNADGTISEEEIKEVGRSVSVALHPS